ncbi:MAG: YbaN family protein [Parvibaculum sp.]
MSLETERVFRRRLLQILGWVCVGLGAIGIVLPIMPTTVFLLIALWAFARSSPTLHMWLLENPYLGPYIVDWEKYGAIPLRAKIMAFVMMSASFTWLSLGTNAPKYVVIGVGVTLVSVATYVLTRPNGPSASDTDQA